MALHALGILVQAKVVCQPCSTTIPAHGSYYPKTLQKPNQTNETNKQKNYGEKPWKIPNVDYIFLSI